jgi:hypothetical protein
MWLIAREGFNALVHPKIFESQVGIYDLMCLSVLFWGDKYFAGELHGGLYICSVGYFQRSVLIIICLLSNYRTGNELHEPKFSEDDMEFIVEDKNIKKEAKEGQYYL